MYEGKLVGEEGIVYALDVDRRALERMENVAKKEGLKNIVRVDTSDDKAIPLSDGTVDMILLIDVLQEIEREVASTYVVWENEKVKVQYVASRSAAASGVFTSIALTGPGISALCHGSAITFQPP